MHMRARFTYKMRLSRLIGTFGRGYFARLIGILIEAIVSLQLYKSEANRADPTCTYMYLPVLGTCYFFKYYSAVSYCAQLAHCAPRMLACARFH